MKHKLISEVTLDHEINLNEKKLNLRILDSCKYTQNEHFLNAHLI